MNADASPGVVANAKVAVTIRGALPVALALLGAGLALAAGAVALGIGGRKD
jgi:hypothetical protein